MARVGYGAFAVAAVILCLVGGLMPEATASLILEDEQEEFSPLFERRLEVGLRNMDKPVDHVYTARMELQQRPVATPASGNPFSLCLGSACFISVCIGSACLNSTCFGSACVTSNCAGSGCVNSGCGGSSCVGSGCLGSVCVGSLCFGSVCLNCPKPPGPGATRTDRG